MIHGVIQDVDIIRLKNNEDLIDNIDWILRHGDRIYLISVAIYDTSGGFVNYLSNAGVEPSECLQLTKS